MSPRKSSRLSLFTKNRLITKPSRLTLGIGAATVAAVTAIAIGATTGSTNPAPAAGNAAAFNRAGGSNVTSHRASASQAPAATGHHTAPRTPARQADARTGAAKPGGAHPVTHRPAAHRAPAAHHGAPAAKPAGPYLMYDSVIPSAIPRHHVAAVYATGPFATSPSAVGVAGRGGAIVWIDVSGADPAASALDVEPTDATPPVAARWALNRLSTRPHAVARIYTMISEWPAVKAAVAGLLPKQMQSRVRWWIADPNGVPHLLPGSDATQWYWGPKYDISTVTPRF